MSRLDNNMRFQIAINEVRAAGHGVSSSAFHADTKNRGNSKITNRNIATALDIAQDLREITERIKTLYTTKKPRQ